MTSATHTKNLYPIYIIFTLFLYQNCTKQEKTEYRIAGFRLEDNSVISIKKKIVFTESKYYLTPEGNKKYSEYKKSSYLLDTYGSQKKLNCLGEGDYYCYYIYSKQIWIAFETASPQYRTEGFIPELTHPVGFVIFTEKDYELHTETQLEPGKILFDRLSETIYYKKINTDSVFQIDLNLQRIVAKSTNNTQVDIIQKLLLGNISLENSLNFDSIELAALSLNRKTQTKMGATEETITSLDQFSIKKTTDSTYTPTRIYYTMSCDNDIYFNCNATTFRSDYTIIRPEMSTCKNNRLYYLSKKWKDNTNITIINIVKIQKNL